MPLRLLLRESKGQGTFLHGGTSRCPAPVAAIIRNRERDGGHEIRIWNKQRITITACPCWVWSAQQETVLLVLYRFLVHILLLPLLLLLLPVIIVTIIIIIPIIIFAIIVAIIIIIIIIIIVVVVIVIIIIITGIAILRPLPLFIKGIIVINAIMNAVVNIIIAIISL